jgi:hypothetical protein
MMDVIRIVAAAILLIGAGLVHGSWTNRWGASRVLAAQSARLDSIPTVLGDWTAKPYELPPEQLAATGAVNYLLRAYSNASRGITVRIMMLYGLPGDVAIHNPDACYPSVGYTLGETTVFNCGYGSPERRAEFRTALASRGGPNPSALRIFWGWNASQGWSAPENPRWAFARAPALCKLYVVRETSGVMVDPKDDACNDFLTLLLPEIDRSVFSVVSPAG